MRGVKTKKTVTERGRRLRVAGLVMAGVMVWSSLIPLFGVLLEARIYNLSPQARQVVGKPNSNLSSKFSYNTDKKSWQFNREGLAMKADAIAEQQGSDDPSGVANALAQMQQQVGGSGKDDNSLYSVNLPEDGSKAVTYYDNNTQLSFKMAPQFSLRDGKLKDGQLVYPLYGGGQLVYTAKSNGLKEDIVLEESRGNDLTFSYKLNLPDTLDVRLQEDGSVGVFSADVVLYSATAGSDGDQAKLDNARETASKDYLLFAIPAPVIKDAKGTEKPGTFTLKDDILTVSASGLDDLAYPLSIDPSVVVTSSSDFTAGNNEGSIDYSTSGQISGMKPTGGSIGSWTAASSMSQSVETPVAIAYNGYMYRVSGHDRATGLYYNTVQRAPINSDGSLGSWIDTTPLPNGGVRYHQAVAYNGYMYVLGGQRTGAVLTDAVYVAPINSNGGLGDWVATTSLPVAMAGHAATVYNGTMYLVGGATTNPPTCGSGGTCLSTVYYSKILANGTLGAWTSTTAFPSTVDLAKAIAYNGYLYVSGGHNASIFTTTYYATINSDGTLGSWALAGANFSGARYGHAMYINNGYMYIGMGYNGKTDVWYAQINSSGTLGAWRAATSYSLGVTYPGATAYDGYLYAMGGYDGANDRSEVYYAKIDSAGTTTSWTTSGNTLASNVSANCTAIYNGTIYSLGGNTTGGESGNVTTVRRAAIASDGSVGAWTTGTVLTAARGYHGCVAYNGKLYVVGGFDSSGVAQSTVYYATINADGSLGASWTTTTALTAALQYAAAFVYTTPDGTTRLYAAGVNGTNMRIYSNPLNTSGVPGGTWTTATSSNPGGVALTSASFTVIGNYIYTFGINASPGGAQSTVYSAPLNTNGTVGSWTATTSLPAARTNAASTWLNGCIYVVGGTSDGTTRVNTNYYACPSSSGTIAAWNTAPTIPTSVSSNAVASYGGRIYNVGGSPSAGNASNTVTYTTVNNGGSGSIIGAAWQADSDVAVVNNRYRHATVVYEGYIYVIGGSISGGGDITTQTVEYAPINSDGTLGAWVADTHELPTARVFLAAAAYKGYMYISGGQQGSGGAFLKTVLYAPISSAGALSGNWASAGGNTTNGAAGATLVAHNGYLYSLGGWDGSLDYNTVQYAVINSNGTIGSWNSTSTFTTARSNLNPFVYGGYMYIAGGEGAQLMRDVQYALINSDGTLGSWSQTTPFVGARKDSAVTAYNGFVYVTGGNDSTNSLADVQFAPILSGGQIGPWQRAFAPVNGDPVGVRSPSGQAIWNGRLYRAGGGMLNGSSSIVMSGAKYLELDSVARVARYSKQIALSSQAGTVTVNYNGTYSPDTTLKFATASSDNIFGALTNGTAGAGSDPGSICSTPTITTVWLSAVMDDSRWATFGGGTPSGITDISVFYTDSGRPAPGQRLFGGKSFRSEILRPLDTCGNV